MNQSTRYPSRRMTRMYLQSANTDAETYSAAQIESTTRRLSDLERRLGYIESDLASLEDDCVYEVFRDSESDRLISTKRRTFKLTERFIWLDPIHHGDKRIRLPKAPIMEGEFIQARHKWWEPDFGLGAFLRPRLEQEAAGFAAAVERQRNELQEMQIAVASGHVPLSITARESLLMIEDCLAAGKEPPVVDWQRFGF